MLRMHVTIYPDLMFVTGNRLQDNKLFLLNYPSRYLVVLYYQANKAFQKLDAQKKEDDLQRMKDKYNLSTPGRN